jgi:hypothetical protein
MHEKGVVSPGADNADLDAVSGIPSGIPIKDVDVIASVQIIDSTFTIDFKCMLVHLNIDRAPPDIVLASFFVYNSLVLGASSSLLSREVDECTSGRDDSALVANSILIKESYWCIALDLDPIHVKTSLREILQMTTDQLAILLAVMSLSIVLVEDVRSNVRSLVRENHGGGRNKGLRSETSNSYIRWIKVRSGLDPKHKRNTLQWIDEDDKRIKFNSRKIL